MDALENQRRPDEKKLRFALYSAVKGKRLVENSRRFVDEAAQKKYINRQIREVLQITDEQSDLVRNQIYLHICDLQHQHISERENIELRKALM